MNAFQVCDSLISQVKYSNLNFTLQESPFSTTISIKKSFIKNKNGEIITGYIKNSFENSCVKTDSKFLADNEILRGDIKTLNSEIKEYEKTIYDLSLRLDKSKVDISELLFQNKSLSEAKEMLAKAELDSSQDTKILKIALAKEIESKKSLVKSLQNDASKHDNEINCANKYIKSKDKDNLSETVERLRDEIGILKSDKVKIQKQLKNVNKKIKKEANKKITSKKCFDASLSASILPPSIDSTLKATSPISNSVTSPISLLSTLSNHSNVQSNMFSHNKVLTTSSIITTTHSNLQSSFYTSAPSSLLSTLSPINLHPIVTGLNPRTLPPTSSTTSSTLPNPRKLQSNLSNLIHPWNDVPLITFSPDQCSRKFCEHPIQCVIRQPRSPPLPSITYLYNEKSKYHQHMMTWSAKEFAGCWKCFSVDNENYGCDDCQWLKWWLKWHGDLHGYPDIGYWIYRKYL